jgi:hypothetical protein
LAVARWRRALAAFGRGTPGGPPTSGVVKPQPVATRTGAFLLANVGVTPRRSAHDLVA